MAFEACENTSTTVHDIIKIHVNTVEFNKKKSMVSRTINVEKDEHGNVFSLFAG